MKTTLKDIARELNLSVNTVSRGLRDMSDVGKETKILIKETAEKLGYRKNLVASNLRTSRSYIMGVVVTDYSNPAMSAIINGVESMGKTKGYTIMTGSSYENAVDEDNVIGSMIDHGVDGIILIPSLTNNRIIEKLKNANIPFVLAVRSFETPPCNYNYIICDDVYGAEIVAERLYSCGHRKFMYLSGLSYISSAKQRYSGFANRLQALGIPLENIQRLQCDGSRIDAYRTTSRWLADFKDKREITATAIFAFSDYVACGVYMALKEHGYQIPQDISVVGYDNNEFSSIIEPSLCTVDNHFYDIGRRAAQRLSELINNETENTESKIQHIITTPELVWRDSVSQTDKGKR